MTQVDSDLRPKIAEIYKEVRKQNRFVRTVAALLSGIIAAIVMGIVLDATDSRVIAYTVDLVVLVALIWDRTVWRVLAWLAPDSFGPYRSEVFTLVNRPSYHSRYGMTEHWLVGMYVYRDFASYTTKLVPYLFVDKEELGFDPQQEPLHVLGEELVTDVKHTVGPHVLFSGNHAIAMGFEWKSIEETMELMTDINAAWKEPMS